MTRSDTIACLVIWAVMLVIIAIKAEIHYRDQGEKPAFTYTRLIP